MSEEETTVDFLDEVVQYLINYVNNSELAPSAAEEEFLENLDYGHILVLTGLALKFFQLNKEAFDWDFEETVANVREEIADAQS